MTKKICIVTGTRAEYGLLKPVIKKVKNDPYFCLQLYVTGAHLSPEFGLTYREIEQDGVPISRKIEMLLSADTPGSIVKSMGVELMGFADALAQDEPDLMLLLGDRYEILAAAAAALIFRIPVAHIHGGELTEGVVDDAIRHSVTKMSCLHFATMEEYRRRIIQLGERPESVYTVGSLGVESIRSLSLLSRDELERQLDFSLEGQVAMVTYHPVTLEKNSAGKQFEALLLALEKYPDLKLIFTKANSDTDGRSINELIDRYVQENPHRCTAFTSMGQTRYLSALQFASVAIGNSSSGIIEVPTFHIPTVNIGDRQKGRVHTKSVISCGTSEGEIAQAVGIALNGEFSESLKDMPNPYELARASDSVVRILKKELDRGISVKKSFFDLEAV